MSAVLLSNVPESVTMNNSSYIIVTIFALLVLGYLIYALFKPEKF